MTVQSSVTSTTFCLSEFPLINIVSLSLPTLTADGIFNQPV